MNPKLVHFREGARLLNYRDTASVAGAKTGDVAPPGDSEMLSSLRILNRRANERVKGDIAA